MPISVYCLINELNTVEAIHSFIRAAQVEVTSINVQDVSQALKTGKKMQCIAYNDGIECFGTCSFKFIELNPNYVYAFDPNVSIKELMLNYYLEQ